MAKSEASPELEAAFLDFQKAQEHIGEQIRARQQLMSQLQENKFVGQEIETLEPDAQIYKLVGPVLIPQETAVAKDNVAKRVEYIEGELKRYEGVIEEKQKEAEEKRNKVLQLQQAAQQGA